MRTALRSALFLLLGAFLAPAHSQELSEKCTTPISVMGECVEIRNCPHVLSMLTNRLSMDTINTLRKYQCGFQGSQPFVCCPEVVERQAPAPAQHPKVKLLPRAVCGYTYQNSIILSPQTHLYQYPWMAVLRYKDANGDKIRCGGVIINERYILTAAHCISKLPKGLEIEKVRLGEHNLSTESDCEEQLDFKECAPPAEDYGIEETIPHPEFDNKNIQHDIGLIRLDRTINFVRESTQPICLPLDQKPSEGATRPLKISGWGITLEGQSSPELLDAVVRTVDGDSCTETYKKHTKINNSTQICVESEYLTSRKCVGDSGGPLIQEVGPKTVLRGIMSFAIGVCRSSTYPRVYTRVEPYVDWILNSMRD